MKKKKLLKSMLSLAMSAALLLTGTVTYGQAEQAAEDGITVTAEADENDFVIDEDGVLTKYTGTAAEVVIPDGVTSIGYRAFWGCSSLTEVTIPGSVESIGDYAFWGCSSLTEVTIPGNVTSTGEGIFYGCGLEKVLILDGVTSIGSYAFFVY